MRRADTLRTKIPKQFGKTVHALRVQRGMSQMKLAEKADLSLAFISNLENGKTLVSIVTIVQLAEAFDLKPSELFKQASM